MKFFYWIAHNRPLIMLVIAVCGIVVNYLNYKHVRDGRCERHDFGYFWRIWHRGETDGKIVMYCSFIAIVAAILFIVSIFMV